MPETVYLNKDEVMLGGGRQAATDPNRTMAPVAYPS